jgi:hypothetical protein
MWVLSSFKGFFKSFGGLNSAKSPGAGVANNLRGAPDDKVSNPALSHFNSFSGRAGRSPKTPQCDGKSVEIGHREGMDSGKPDSGGRKLKGCVAEGLSEEALQARFDAILDDLDMFQKTYAELDRILETLPRNCGEKSLSQQWDEQVEAGTMTLEERQEKEIELERRLDNLRH